MCELMGMCFAQPISADFSIREFAARGEENADGWGLAWYPDRSVAVVKEAVKWKVSQYTGFLETYQRLLSRIYLAHVRHKTTGGEPTHADTHPFVRELGGREYCLAHNGTLAEAARQLPLGRFRPLGSTDSEHFFCHLLDELSQQENPLANEPSWDQLHRKLVWVNQLGKLNCLLSDGERLFCYHDANGWKGLNYRSVYITDQQTRHFGDPTLQVDLESGLFNHGLVVATTPLSTSGWDSFRKGELLVLEGGKIRFSSHRGKG